MDQASVEHGYMGLQVTQRGLSLQTYIPGSCSLSAVNVNAYSHRWARLLTQQTSFTVYLLPTKENKLAFSVSVCCKQTEVCRFPYMNTYTFTCTYIYIYIYTAVSSEKPEPRRFSLICFNVCSLYKNGSLSFVCLLTKKQMEVNGIRLQMDLPIYVYQKV